MRTFVLSVALGLVPLTVGCLPDLFHLPVVPKDLPADGKARRQKVIAAVKERGRTIAADPNSSDVLVMTADLHGFPSAGDILDALVPLTKLRVLSLFNTAFTDTDLGRLQGSPELSELNLNNNQITDAGLERLRSLPRLQQLSLNDTLITDNGVQTLGSIATLKELNLHHTRVTDAGLAHLRSLKYLEKLGIGGPTITDQGLANLKGMTSLRELFVVKSKITDAGVRDLQKALPNLRIIR